MDSGQKTPLYSRHRRLGARLCDFHGWVLPIQYAGVHAEHGQCRNSAALFDTCHMGQFHILGPAAAGVLATVCTQDSTALEIARCRYGFLLNDNGGIIDDTILMRLAEDEFLLVVNAGTRQSDLDWLRRHLDARCDLQDRSDEWGKIDLQGPRSYEALAPLAGFDLASMQYFHAARGEVGGHGCIVSRTGYTGELGYEIFAPAGAICELWDALLESELIAPAGLGARDLLRLEMGYPLHGVDISEQNNPIEADMERFVDFERDYIGAAALRRVAADGPSMRLVAFASGERRKSQPGQQICDDAGAPAGHVTSGNFSPSLGVSVGMGYVRAELAVVGQKLAVRSDRGEMEVVVASRPLYTKGTCRTNRLAEKTR